MKLTLFLRTFTFIIYHIELFHEIFEEFMYKYLIFVFNLSMNSYLASVYKISLFS